MRNNGSALLGKAFNLLEAMADNARWCTLGELATTNGLSRPTCYRVLQCLLKLGYVEKSEPDTYRLSGKLCHLMLRVDEPQMIAAAAPILDGLHLKTHQALSLGVLRNQAVAILYAADNGQPHDHAAKIHSAIPFLCTAIGQVIVAHENPRRQEFFIIQSITNRWTGRVVGERNQILQRLNKVREDGYAVEYNLNNSGINCISTPIFCAREVVGAINIAAPTADVDVDFQALLVRLMREAACEISSELMQTKDSAMWHLLLAGPSNENASRSA